MPYMVKKVRGLMLGTEIAIAIEIAIYFSQLND